MKHFKKFRYIMFLFKPYWTYGKLYMIVTLGIAIVLTPASQVLSQINVIS